MELAIFWYPDEWHTTPIFLHVRGTRKIHCPRPKSIPLLRLIQPLKRQPKRIIKRIRRINKRQRHSILPPLLNIRPIQKIQSLQLTHTRLNTLIINKLIIIQIQPPMMIYNLYLLNIRHLDRCNLTTKCPIIWQIQWLVKMDQIWVWWILAHL